MFRKIRFYHADLPGADEAALRERHKELAGSLLHGPRNAELRAELVRIDLELLKRDRAKGSKTL